MVKMSTGLVWIGDSSSPTPKTLGNRDVMEAVRTLSPGCTVFCTGFDFLARTLAWWRRSVEFLLRRSWIFSRCSVEIGYLV